MHIVPDSSEIIKFDEEGNVGLKARALDGFRRFLDSRLFLVVLLLLTAVVSFELGLLANITKQKQPITITEPTTSPDALPFKTELGGKASDTGEGTEPKTSQGEGTLLASKGGAKYYYPWCGSAARISEKNKIYFASVAEARAKGYTPASNCKGLE